MPLYPLKCAACNHRFELLASFRELEKAVCPNCGSGELARDYMNSSFASPVASGKETAGSCCKGPGFT